MFPAFVVSHPEIDLDERPPFGSFRFADQVHARFIRRMVGLAGITLDTGANDILPSGRTATITWNHMVEVQILSLKNFAAVLAGVLVALEDIVASELHFLLRHAIEEYQHDDARHANLKGDAADAFGMGLLP